MPSDVIHCPNRIKQIIDFTGMRYANSIMPTDIDAFLDFGNKLHIYVEAKFEDRELEYGQQLALERACDDCSIECVLLLVRHKQPETERVDLANTKVDMVRYQKQWWSMENDYTCRQFVDKILTISGRGWYIK
jgi:hypothetical protein